MPQTTRHAFVLLLLVASGCRERDDPTLIRVAGHVEATEVRVATKLGGTLEWFEIAEGDRVDVGRELARFSTIDQRLVLEAAGADRDLADAQVRLQVAGFRREDIAEAAAQVARVRVDLEAAERDLKRFQGLLDSGSGTEKNRDDALARRAPAARTMAAAQDGQRKLEAGFRSA
ncbi:MAG: hypothetical protein GY856_52030, partial [bacterium]|nr:hypothetical protein [bacterium]